MKKFLKIYGIITILLVHLAVWIYLGYDNTMFNWQMPVVDIILTSILMLLAYLFSNLAFFFPFLCIMSGAIFISAFAATSIIWFPIGKLACYLGSDMFIMFANISWLWMLIIPFISAIGIMNIVSWYYLYKTYVE